MRENVTKDARDRLRLMEGLMYTASRIRCGEGHVANVLPVVSMESEFFAEITIPCFHCFDELDEEEVSIWIEMHDECIRSEADITLKTMPI